MMLLICLLVPPIILAFIRKKIFHTKGYIENFESYILAVILLNYIMLLISHFIFANDDILINKLSSFNEFSYKYLILSICIGTIEPFVEGIARFCFNKIHSTIKNHNNIDTLKKNIIVGIIFIGISLTIVAVSFQYIDYSKPKHIDASKFEIANSDYECNIDIISDSEALGKLVYIEGWAVHIGEDLNHFNMQLVLYQDNLDDALIFKLTKKTGEDITDHYNDGYNYDSSGFIININRDTLKENKYHIAILYDDTESEDDAKLILTDNYLICEQE